MKIEQLRNLAFIGCLLFSNWSWSQQTFELYKDRIIHGNPFGKMGSKNGTGLTIEPDYKENPMSDINSQQ